jgi:hypothetical protein
MSDPTWPDRNAPLDAQARLPVFRKGFGLQVGGGLWSWGRRCRRSRSGPQPSGPLASMPGQFRELLRQRSGRDALEGVDQPGQVGVGEDRMAVLGHETKWACVVCLSHGPSRLFGMQLRYRYRLDPTPAQRQALACAFGCARVVYNEGLRLREDAYRAGLPFVGGWSCPDGSSRSPSRPRNGRGSGRSLPWRSSSRWRIGTAPTATTSGTCNGSRRQGHEASKRRCGFASLGSSPAIMGRRSGSP